MSRLSLAQRLEKYSTPVPECGCTVWLGAVKSPDAPYGYVGVGRRMRLAHRVAWELEKGPIPEGMFVLHSCDNPSCINTNHLFLGTHDDNMADMVLKNRSGTGEKNSNAKLSQADVDAIRASTLRPFELAKKYNVSDSNIVLILSNQSWRKLP